MTEILGYKIFDKSKQDLMEFIKGSPKKLNIISGNPEVLYNGLQNSSLYNNFNNSYSVIIPDGVGVVLASKLIKEPVKEKIAGIEVMENIIEYCSNEGKSIFLLGAEQTVLEKCADKLKEKYPSLIISGQHNGFFDLDNCGNIIDAINSANPYAIFVAMGSPRQENFIYTYIDKLNAKLFMGVGGSFDVFAGKVNRAPSWMIKCHLEWLYRVSKEPKRIKRLGAIPKFIYKVVVDNK